MYFTLQNFWKEFTFDVGILIKNHKWNNCIRKKEIYEPSASSGRIDVEWFFHELKRLIQRGLLKINKTKAFRPV